MSQSKTTRPEHGRVYLCAPINALVEGVYEEHIPFFEIKQHGDFGLGTFDHLDGEMVMIDGRIFQITGDGHVSEVGDDAATPFAAVTFFETHSSDSSDQAMTYAEFQHWLDNLLPSQNMFYAFRIEGTFKHVRVRSVPKQECYRPLIEVAKDQPTFDFYDIAGTLAGFYTPSFMASLSVPGMHLHFLSKDFQHGGHLLECSTQKIDVALQFINKVELSLPTTLDYMTLDFQRDINQDLEKAEK